MSITMKDLVIATGESKSTIHYYLKEGLLPEPSKPKPNVHYYDNSCINIIKFIKHLQNNFSYTISEIKAVFSKNNLDFNNSIDFLMNSLNMISGTKDGEIFSKDRFLILSGIDEEKLNQYIKEEFLFERAKGYTSKELEIVSILKKAEELNLDITLFKEYVKKARELAELEFEIGAKLLNSDENNHTKHYELLFDIVLSLKPYIFNMETVTVHQRRIIEGENI